MTEGTKVVFQYNGGSRKSGSFPDTVRIVEIPSVVNDDPRYVVERMRFDSLGDLSWRPADAETTAAAMLEYVHHLRDGGAGEAVGRLRQAELRQESAEYRKALAEARPE